MAKRKRKTKTERQSTPPRPLQPRRSRRAASFLPPETYARLKARQWLEHARRVLEMSPAERDAELEREQAARDVRNNLTREFEGWLYDQNLPGWDDISPDKQDRLLMRFARDATYLAAKRKSGETRRVRTIPPKNFDEVFDPERKKFPSDTATARHIADKRIKFRDRRGEKVTLSRNAILDYVNDRKKEPSNDVT